MNHKNIDEMDFVKNCGSLKNTVKKMARQPIEKKKILSSRYLKKNLFPEYI